MVVLWIFNSLKEYLHDKVVFYKEAYEMCTDFEECLSLGNTPLVHELKHKISLCIKGKLTYYTKLKEFWDELRIYSKALRCTSGVIKKIVIECDIQAKLY